MGDFRQFFLGLDGAARVEFAKRANTTVGYLNQVMYGNKRIELGFADVLVALSNGALTLDKLPLTDRARAQHATRCDNEAKAA